MERQKFFLKAVSLAQSVKGSTSPNPAVGCVIVKKNRVLSTGATRKAGMDHAEAVALKKAGASARNASMYVTLEPCVDYPGKKTSCCVSQIIRSGIKEVFIGMKDPNPCVNGKGILQLRQAGIKVHIVNGYKKEIQLLNEDFFKFITTGNPFVYMKAAMTLDGNIATLDGDSKWISGEESRAWVHSLRNRVDAIMAGIGTVLKDNPQLNVRMVKKIKDPVRYIIDPDGRTPSNCHVMNDDGKTVFIVKKGISERFRELCVKNGREWMEFDAPDGKFRIKDILARLGREKCVESLLVEGGGKLFHGFFAENAVDRMIVCIAPKILGGKGTQLFNGETGRKISEALRLKDISVETIGDDILIQGTF